MHICDVGLSEALMHFSWMLLALLTPPIIELSFSRNLNPALLAGRLSQSLKNMALTAYCKIL